MTYPISHLRPDYFLAREIRKKVNLASESPLVLRRAVGCQEWSGELMSALLRADECSLER